MPVFKSFAETPGEGDIGHTGVPGEFEVFSGMLESGKAFHPLRIKNITHIAFDNGLVIQQLFGKTDGQLPVRICDLLQFLLTGIVKTRYFDAPALFQPELVVHIDVHGSERSR